MSEQVERKKSYRWVSAGHATYDGADWDSSDDSIDENGNVKKGVVRNDTISKLPALPKLHYDDENSEVVQEGTKESSQDSNRDQLSERICPQSLVADDGNDEIITWETPKLAKISSRNSSKSSLQVKRTPVNEDLENLMAQISKEMTPKIDQTEDFNDDEVSLNSDRILSTGLEKEPLSAGESDDDLEVAKNGYFAKYVNDEEDKNYVSSGESSTSDIDVNDRQLPASPAREFADHNDMASEREDEESQIVSPPLEKRESVSSRHESHKTPRSSFDYRYSSDEADEGDEGDEGDDALSYTDSIQYQNKEVSPEEEPESRPRKYYQYEAQEDDLVVDSDEEIQVPKSGYFNKMVHSDEDSHEDEEERTIPETIESADEPEEEESTNRTAIKAIDNEVTNGLVAAEQDAEGKEKSDDNQPELEETIIEENDGKENEEKQPSTRQSINLGKWKPDTGAARSGFVQETSNNPPPGYVYDETGKLVDLTPSSMKSRIVSTYSEVESSWNAFPSEGKDDLETIKDTKTLYDNNTIHNVPGIITNNQNLPPLPDIVHPVTSNDSSDDPRSFATGNSTYTTLDGEAHRGPGQTHFKEVFTVPEPKADEIAKVTGQTKVPYLDMVKVLNGKASHVNKIQQLREYSKQLDEFDSGIQTWLNYTLKSSSKTDRDFIFDEYKVSKHVRDAYANADELSKKHTVSNTVANVNQNVSHLTRKVFAHSKKSRGLFSSIAKKKVSI